MKEATTSLELQKIICQLYVDGFSPSEIVKMFPRESLSTSMIHYYLKKHSIRTRSNSESHILYNKTEDYFSSIDSHEKAQVLGFIAADGCITESKSGQRVLTIAIHNMDTDYLEYIKRSLKYTGPITKMRAIYVRLGITSSRYFEDLIKLGITERKSLTLPFPNTSQVPDEFIGSYVCGYFEGDGSVGIRNGRKLSTDVHLSICVTLEFGTRLKQLLSEKLNIGSTITRKRQLRERDINSYNLMINGNCQAIKAMDWMYANVPFKMMRKYSKFDEVRSLYDHNGDFIKTDEWRKLKKEKFLAGMKRNGRDPSQNVKKEAYYLSPDTKVFHVTGVAAFAREMGLQCAGLSRLNGGVQTKYRGWSLATTDQITAARAANTIIEKSYV